MDYHLDLIISGLDETDMDDLLEAIRKIVEEIGGTVAGGFFAEVDDGKEHTR